MADLLAAPEGFGALRDGFSDYGRLDRAEYRALRRALRREAPEAATVRYIRQLRNAERTRPAAAGQGFQEAAAIAAYRRRVLEVSLVWLQDISAVNVAPSRFHALVDMACLAQLADDLFDWEEDHAWGRPSYVTARLKGRTTGSSAVAAPLRAQANGWRDALFETARRDAAVLPFAFAGALIWCVAVVLVRVHFLR
jgi:hypothetical protein